MADENILFPMLLANLVVCVELNLALFNLTLVFHRSRTSVVRELAFSRSSHHSDGAGTPYRKSRSFSNSHWLKMPKISQSRIFGACAYYLTYDTACPLASSSVLVWTVAENAAKTVVWMRIER